MSNGIGHVWAVNAEGGDEGRPNGVGPVWIDNADQLGSKLPEPASGDAGKVLGVLNSDGDIGWVPDQGGMAQVQADWDQGDPSEVSYIANKPTIPSGVQLVPAATSADENKVLTVDSLGVPGWAVVPEQSTGLFQAVYGETSFADITQAFNDKKIVYCRIGSTRPSRMAYLAYVNATYFEFQYYRSISSHSASAQTDEIYIYKVTSDGWETTTRKTGVSVAAGTHMSQSYSNDTLTLNAAWPDVDQTYNAASTNAQSGVAVAGALTSYTPTASLSTVATTGEYADLLHKPTIPTVPDTKPVVAGSNVTITENANDITISATDTTYSAGTGMTLTGTTFSVDNPLPTSAVGDAGKVLTVDTQGAPAWGMLGSVASIQQVTSLPASPDANTLYLIPEA